MIGALECSYACVALVDSLVVLEELLELLGGEACAIGIVEEEESSLAKKAICLSCLASSIQSSSFVEHC